MRFSPYFFEENSQIADLRNKLAMCRID